LLARLFSWLPAYRLLMVWVYDRTGSLLVAMLMHVSLVASTVIIEPPLTGGALLTYILARAAVLWIIVVVVAVAQRRAA
jgi:membrane protease YdiL (CAAX protease family)